MSIDCQIWGACKTNCSNFYPGLLYENFLANFLSNLLLGLPLSLPSRFLLSLLYQRLSWKAKHWPLEWSMKIQRNFSQIWAKFLPNLRSQWFLPLDHLSKISNGNSLNWNFQFGTQFSNQGTLNWIGSRTLQSSNWLPKPFSVSIAN